MMESAIPQVVVKGLLCCISAARAHLIKSDQNRQREFVVQVFKNWTKVVRSAFQLFPKSLLASTSYKLNDPNETIGVAFFVNRPGIEERCSFVRCDEISCL